MVAIVRAPMRSRSGRLARMCRGGCVVVAAVLCSAAPAQKPTQYPQYDPYSACAQKYLNDTARVGSFTFRTYRTQEGGCLRVVRGGKEILLNPIDNNGYYTLGQRGDMAHGVPAIANGTDITGRGRPDMIVTFYTGGLHCCTVDQVYELEPKFKLLAALDAKHGSLAHFALIGHEYYFMAADWTFAYWRTDFADSPAPGVILRFVDDGKGGSYHLALDKMQQPDPTPEEWRKDLSEARGAFTSKNPFGHGIGSELWGNMLELIYTGRSPLAWKLLDETWPATKPGKGAFLGDFCSQLKTSPYWADLEPTLHDAPPACLSAKPKNTGM